MVNSPIETTSITIQEFLDEFKGGLLTALQDAMPPLYGADREESDYAQQISQLKRTPYPAQYHAAVSQTELLLDHGSEAGIIYGEMGCGKTMMAITAMHLFACRGFMRSLVICPPHLVYKWRREIHETLPDCETLILNGPQTIKRLIELRRRWENGELDPSKPFVAIIGRVRMRLGFYWRAALQERVLHYPEQYDEEKDKVIAARSVRVLSCPSCNTPLESPDKEHYLANPANRELFSEKRKKCLHCHSPLWTMKHRSDEKSLTERLTATLCELPTLGKATAKRLIANYGEEQLANWIEENPHNFINLRDAEGEFIFPDRKAERIERYLGKTEFSLVGGGNYQPSEWIKRYLPQNFFDLLVVDEGHELKGGNSAQGLAFGTLSTSCRKKLLLTGTLMGGYASDLFHLLWRLSPKRMIDDGFHYRAASGLGNAEMSFMRSHGVLKDIFVDRGPGSSTSDFKTSKGGSKTTHRVAKAPGFSPLGLMRYLTPITSFVRMADIGSEVLPSYTETYVEVEMAEEQRECYDRLTSILSAEMREALIKGDRTLLGMVLMTSLAWPETCFRAEYCRHPRTRVEIASAPALFGEEEPTPKEAAIIQHILEQKKRGRKCLLYTVFSGTRDTTSRWKHLLALAEVKASVLRSTVATDKREDWVLAEVDKGIDVLITNPELVKTGLDLLDFPAIFFANTGYSVYTVQQASRRSWRIGQTQDVEVFFYGYSNSAQTACLDLMSQKISVAQSTSGEMPDTGLDVLNSSPDSLEIALAKKIIKAT